MHNGWESCVKVAKTNSENTGNRESARNTAKAVRKHLKREQNSRQEKKKGIHMYCMRRIKIRECTHRKFMAHATVDVFMTLMMCLSVLSE